MRALTMMKRMLDPIQRLLLRRGNVHGMRMRRQSRLRVHSSSRMRSKIRHGPHIPLQGLHGKIRILQLCHGVCIPRQKIRRTLCLKMTRERAKVTPCRKPNQRCRCCRCHLAKIRGRSRHICGLRLPSKQRVTAPRDAVPLTRMGSSSMMGLCRAHRRRLQVLGMLLMRALPGLLRGMERARVSHHLELIFFSFLSFSLFPFFLMFLDSKGTGAVLASGTKHVISPRLVPLTR